MSEMDNIMSLLADGVKMGEGWAFDNREYVEETGEEMIELKACAHCGHKAATIRYEHENADVQDLAYCPNNDCPMHHRTMSIKDWEFRPIEDALLARAEKAEAMVERLIEAVESGERIQIFPESDIKTLQEWYAKVETIIAEWKEREE
jgi:hypothetical protein